MDPACLLLAVLNAAEAALCLLDHIESRTPKTYFALLSWTGSTVFWLVRGVVPV